MRQFNVGDRVKVRKAYRNADEKYGVVINTDTFDDVLIEYTSGSRGGAKRWRWAGALKRDKR